MTDYDDLIQGLLDMKTVDFTGTRVARDATAAIKELVAERDLWKQRYEAMEANCDGWVSRADKAEAELAAASVWKDTLGVYDEWVKKHSKPDHLNLEDVLSSIDADLAAARAALREYAHWYGRTLDQVHTPAVAAARDENDTSHDPR